MAEQDGQEKTEAPTEKKRNESRDEGQVAFSKELSSTALLAGILLVLFMTSSQILEALRLLMSSTFKEMVTADELTIRSLYQLSEKIFGIILPPFMPFAAAIIFIGIFASVIQVGVKLTLKPLAPKFSKISPMSGLKKLFSSQSVADLLKSMGKMIIVGFIGYLTFMEEMGKINGLAVMSPESIMEFNFTVVMEVAGKIMLALIVIAIFDFFYQRWHHEQQLMMTKQQVKEENKQSEGDPHLKSKIRQIQREMSAARMMQEVPKADAIVVNPTHFSIAIKYDREVMVAPEVTAKGVDHLALRMRTVAKENNIPILERPALARDLYANVEIGQDMPERFYKAIAEILAFVYRLKKK